MITLRTMWLSAGLLGILASCSSDIQEPPFSGSRSYEYLKMQVDLGPRVPGSEASREARKIFVSHFLSCGLGVDSQSFTITDPYSGNDTPMVNIIASHTGSGKDRILFMAHYDCRPFSDKSANPEMLNKPIDGANDGASGVAVLMEIANLIKEQPPAVSVDLALVDGEDWGKAGHADFLSLGSQEFARRGIRGKYRFAIVADMVGDADLTIKREGFSHMFAPIYVDMIHETAARLGIAGFQDAVGDSLIDDHLPLLAAGIPAVDIIDFDYPYWHTEYDTPDRCSPASLEAVGRVMTHILYHPSVWPQK